MWNYNVFARSLWEEFLCIDLNSNLCCKALKLRVMCFSDGSLEVLSILFCDFCLMLVSYVVFDSWYYLVRVVEILLQYAHSFVSIICR